MKNYEKLIPLFKQNNLKIDSFLVANKNDILFEHYYPSHSPTSLHRGFSITKNLTMLGIGYLVTIGKLNLDDKIISYFPEFNVGDPLINKMTIKNLLTMQTTFKSTTYKRSGDDYLKSFFTTKPEKEPGNIFAYDTSASYTLAALVEKLTNKKLIVFLKETIFKEHKLSDRSYIELSYENISLGGSGLFSTLKDLLTIGRALLTNGFGTIDHDFMKMALEKQVDTTNFVGGDDFKVGYGFQTWINKTGGFTCYGMYGQLIYFDKIRDLLLVTHSNLSNERPETQKIIDLFNSLNGGVINE